MQPRTLACLALAAAFPLPRRLLTTRANRRRASRRNPQRRSPVQPGRRADRYEHADHSGISVNEVSLIFTVTDRHGHYIPNLNQSDFALLDNQKAPAKVNSFHQQINLPLRVGIVIDASSSIRSRFQFEQQSATEFLLQVLQARRTIAPS